MNKRPDIKTLHLEDKIDYIVQEFNNWRSLESLSKELGCNRHALAKLLQNHGFDTKRYIRPKNKTPNWSGHNDISGKYFYDIQHGAESRNLEFNITIEQIWELFLKQDRKCALSGVELVFETSSKTFVDKTASLDRIDSSKGYTIDNVQWINKKLNIMKRDMTDSQFKNWCHKVTINSELMYNG